MNNLNIFDYTQLAEASYADFWDPKTNQLITSSEGVAKKLQPDEKGEGSQFSATQAKELTDHWSVLAQYRERGGDGFGLGDLLPNGETGFSATLFQRKVTGEDTGEYVFACKGTLGLTDILTDVGDLVHDGLAMYQIVDMYNFWQQITAPKGESYKVRVLEEDTALLEDLIKGKVSVASLQAQGYVIESNLGAAGSGYKRVMRFVEKDASEIYTDDRALGLGINPEKVTVVGHSLGGHLASAFSRLFPDIVENSIMINGAGYADFGTSGIGHGNIQNVFKKLDGEDHFEENKIFNIIGDKGNVNLRPTFLSCFSH